MQKAKEDAIAEVVESAVQGMKAEAAEFAQKAEFSNTNATTYAVAQAKEYVWRLQGLRMKAKK